VHRLTKERARRIAVRARMLEAPRPTELGAVDSTKGVQAEPEDLAFWPGLKEEPLPEGPE
jgi:hypothetical protein